MRDALFAYHKTQQTFSRYARRAGYPHPAQTHVMLRVPIKFLIPKNKQQ